MAFGIVNVVGFHGTSVTAAEEILRVGFKRSENDYDWLGHGIYFWLDAPTHAWKWAERQHGSEAAVLAADIELRDCMDFLDIEWNSFLREAYDSYVAHMKTLGLPLPAQSASSKAHRLDRAVLNHAVGILEDRGFSVRSLRGGFAEGGPVFPNSFLFDEQHVQIAVRDPSVITNVRPLSKGGAV